MPAEGLCGAGFSSPSGTVYLATLVHQGSPLAYGCSGPGKAQAPPQLPTALRRLLRTLSLGQKASGKGSVCPSAMGWLPWYPVLEGAEPHGNQWSPAHTKTPV